jgi:hypothetical protein
MVHELAPVFPEQLVAEDAARAASGPGPQRFALPADVTITPATHGTWETLPDGGRLWRLRVSSPHATDLNFGFSRFRLPAGATLHLVSLDHDYYQGPFTADDNRPHGELWTPVIPGQQAVVELYVQPDPAFDPELVLGRIGRGYRDLFRKTGQIAKQGSCNIDVLCGSDDGLDWVDDWRAEIQSVAMYSINGFQVCTGTMVIDVPRRYTPFFLTAYHCGVTEGNAHTVVTYWNFHSPDCGQLGGGTLDQSLAGATLLARREDADFCLLQLVRQPPAAYRVYWSGWDRRLDYVPQGSVTIHHPRTDEKAISLNDDPFTIRDNCIVAGTTDTHWEVDNWEQGTTEQGSSGAGLWDTHLQLLVGTLSGGLAACGNDLWDCYGRFAVSWDGPSADQRLRDWLDPTGTWPPYMIGGPLELPELTPPGTESRRKPGEHLEPPGGGRKEPFRGWGPPTFP